MKWSEISIHTTEEAIEPISNILHEAGASGVVIEDPKDLEREWDTSFGEVYALNPADYPTEGIMLKAYLPVNSSLTDSVDQIKENINSLLVHDIDIGLNQITLTEVNEDDWANAWKKYYKPVRISEKITIVPSWEEYNPSEQELIIELDPGMAFGTGTHPTTTLCIQAIEKYMTEGDHVIDVGTGSGVLSIAAAKLGAESVDAYDLDDVAVQSAIANVQLNHVEDTVTVKQNNLLDHVTGQADLIVGNLLADIILKFTDDAAKVLKNNGLFITSGIIKQKEQEVKESLIENGFTIEETLYMKDWVAIVAKKK